MEEHIPPAKQPVLQAEPQAKTAKPGGSGWRWFWLIVLALVCAGGWYMWSKGGLTPAAAGSVPPSKGKKGGGGAVPVVAVKARKGNIGVYIDGLGNVTPIYTDMVKSRVDGELMSVHFNEGDIVHKGDLLIEIDPRPYQVALEQAEGQKVRDEAILENARVDLDRYKKLLDQNAVNEQQWATQKALVDQTIGIVKTDQGVIDGDKLNLVYCHITASIGGRVGLRLVDPGNIVHATDTNPLLVITQVQPISVIFTVREDDLPTWCCGNRCRPASASRCLRSQLGVQDRHRDAGHGGQPDRSHHRKSPPPRQLRQQQQSALPQPVRQFAAAGGGKNRCGAGEQRGDPALQQQFHLGGEGKQHGNRPDCHYGSNRRRLHGNHQRVGTRRRAVMTGVDKLTEGTPVTVAMADQNGSGKSGGKKK
jgi:hypothetical protein